MHEHLERHRCLFADCQDLVDRKLPRDDHPLHAERLGQRDALGAGECHLRGAMQRQVGTDLADEPGRADILHEHGIDARRRHRLDHPGKLRQLAAEDQHVERGIPLEPAQVEHLHQPGQVFEREVCRAGPGVEADVEPEVDGVSPVLDRRADAVPIPGRGEQFDTFSW